MSTAPTYQVDPQHRLQAAAGSPHQVDHSLRTPNLGRALAPRAIVLHYTAGGTALGSARWLCDPKAKASAHLVIERDGRVWQLAPFNVQTWHAGTSRWQKWVGLNQYAIGIELANYGWDVRRRADGSYHTPAGQALSDAQVLRATHRLERIERSWERYPALQVAAAVAVCAAVQQRYPAATVIVGHDNVAPERKRDPGPAWDWDAFHTALYAYRG